MSKKYKIANRLHKLLAIPFPDGLFQEAVEMA